MLSDFEKFDAVVRKVFSVSHDEIVKREKEYKKRRKRAKQKRAKSLPASRASSDTD
jgi:hypothetical protein